MTAAGRRALVVGVNDYGDDRIPSLKGAVNDAKEIYERLTKFGEFEIPPDHLLLDRDATTSNIRQALSDLLWKVDESEISIIYFSGHGITDSYGNGFIAPHDMAKDHPLVNGIRMQEIRELMLAARNKQTVLLLLDCCYSGIASDGDKEVSGSSFSAIERCLSPLNDSSANGQGRIVFTSSGNDERSREDLNLRHRLGNADPHAHGAFTFQLLEGLDGRACSKDNSVSLGSLMEFVGNAFPKNSEHTPKMYGSSVQLLGDIYIARTTMQSILTAQIEQVNELLAQPEDYNDLFRAIGLLEKVLVNSPEMESAHQLRDRIDERLGRLENSAQGFLSEHELTLSEGCQATFDTLAILLCNVNFAAISTKDRSLRALLSTLFRVQAKQLKKNMLQKRLLAYESQFPGGKINPPGELTP